jgi:hypothetical protein
MANAFEEWSSIESFVSIGCLQKFQSTKVTSYRMFCSERIVRTAAAKIVPKTRMRFLVGVEIHINVYEKSMRRTREIIGNDRPEYFCAESGEAQAQQKGLVGCVQTRACAWGSWAGST